MSARQSALVWGILIGIVAVYVYKSYKARNAG